MVKNLRYLLMSMLVMLTGSVMAQAEFDFDANGTTLLGLPGESSGSGASAVTDGDITEAKTATIGDYSLTVSAGVPNDKGKVATPNRLWNTAPKLRMYTGTLTIATKGANFKSIVFTLATQASKAKWNDGNTASVGKINADAATTVIWSGDAKEVEFTIAGNTQISKITISTEETTIDPTPEPQPQPEVETVGKGTLESPYTAADAVKVATALGDGNTSTADYYVKAKISSVTYAFDVQHGTATFNISDNGEAANEFLCYGVYYLENKSWLEGNTQIKVGDEVIICGKLTNYKGTPETASKKAYIYSLNGVTKNEGGEEPTPEPTPSDVVKATCAEILAGTDGTVYEVKGVCTEIKNTSYGNWMLTDKTGEVYIYGTLDAEGKTKNFESLNIEVGDTVTVQGPRKTYNETIELVNVTVVNIAKKDGGEEPQPAIETITVAQAMQIGAALEAGKSTDAEYIVNGFVVAEPAWNPWTDKNTGEIKNYNLQFQMNDTQGSTENALLVYNAWNLDNTYFPTIDDDLAVGTEVSLQGKIQNYVKNEVSTIELVKAHFLKIGSKTGVEAVKAGKRFEGAVYNMNGQRVKVAGKGLFIRDGKKFFVK